MASTPAWSSNRPRSCPGAPVEASVASIPAEQSPSSSISRWLPKVIGVPSMLPRTPRPGMAAKSSTSRSTTPASVAARAMACETGWSERAARLAATDESSFRTPRSTIKSVCAGLPWVIVPVLSSARTASLRPSSRIDAAFDQDAIARGRGQAADDGHRRGDHQGAGAGNDQQHQRLVDPVEPTADPRAAAAPPPPAGPRRTPPACRPGRTGRRSAASAPGCLAPPRPRE